MEGRNKAPRFMREYGQYQIKKFSNTLNSMETISRVQSAIRLYALGMISVGDAMEEIGKAGDPANI